MTAEHDSDNDGVSSRGLFLWEVPTVLGYFWQK